MKYEKGKTRFCTLKLPLLLRDYGKSKIVANLTESAGRKPASFFGEVLDNQNN